MAFGTLNLLPPDRQSKRSLAAHTALRWQRTTHVLGIEIAEREVRAAHVVHPRGSAPQLRTIHREPLAAGAIVNGAIGIPEAVVRALQDAHAACAARGLPRHARVATAIGGSHVVTRRIALPEMSNTGLRASVMDVTEQYLPFNINDVYLDYERAAAAPEDDPGNGDIRVCIHAVKREDVDDRLALLARAGIPTDAVETSAWAMERAMLAAAANDAGARNPTIVRIHVDTHMVTLTIGALGAPTFVRDVSFGTQQIVEEIQKQLDITDAEAEHKFHTHCEGGDDERVAAIVSHMCKGIVAECWRSINFHHATAAADMRIERIILCGPGARIPDFARTFDQWTQAELPVEETLPVETFSGIHVPMGYSPEDVRDAMVAIGLAYRTAWEASAATGNATVRGLSPNRGHFRRRAPARPYHANARELERLFEALAFLIADGTALLPALRAIADDPEIGGRKFRGAIAGAAEQIEGGATTADTFAEFLRLRPVLIEAIRTGETGGTLDLSIEHCRRFLRGEPIDDAPTSAYVARTRQISR